MSPETKTQPVQDEAPEGLVTDAPKGTETEDLLTAGEQEPLLEAGEPKIIDASDVPAGNEPAADTVPIPVVEPFNAPMQEFGGNTRITSPTLEQLNERKQIVEAAAASLRTSDDGDVSPVRPYVKQ